MPKLREKKSNNLFMPRRNSNSFCPSGMPKTLMTVPCGGKPGQEGLMCNKREGSGKRKSSPHLLWSTSQLCAGGVECESCQGTVMGLDQRHSALKGQQCTLTQGCSFPPWGFQVTWKQLHFFPLLPHQVVGIIDCDLSHGGATRIRQEGVAMVDGECTETYKGDEDYLVFYLFFFFS